MILKHKSQVRIEVLIVIAAVLLYRYMRFRAS